MTSFWWFYLPYIHYVAPRYLVGIIITASIYGVWVQNLGLLLWHLARLFFRISIMGCEPTLEGPSLFLPALFPTRFPSFSPIPFPLPFLPSHSPLIPSSPLEVGRLKLARGLQGLGCSRSWNFQHVAKFGWVLLSYLTFLREDWQRSSGQ